MLSYMPNRGDFDQDYDYDLELVLAEIEYFSDDNTREIQQKDEVIQYYLNRQDERFERKKFVLDRGFLPHTAQNTSAKRRDEKKKTKR